MLSLFNIITKSLKDGVFPENLKHAIVISVLKNKNADTESFKSYQPISNLSFVSKLLEKTVLWQLNIGFAYQNEIYTNQNEVYTNQNKVYTNQNDICIDQNEICTDQNEISTNRNEISTNRNEISTNRNEICTDQNEIKIFATTL